MNESRRWVVILLIALLAIGFVALALRREHRRGDEVGALRSPVATSTTERREAPL